MSLKRLLDRYNHEIETDIYLPNFMTEEEEEEEEEEGGGGGGGGGEVNSVT